MSRRSGNRSRRVRSNGASSPFAAFYGDVASSISAAGKTLIAWGLATIVAGTPLVETDTVTGKTCIRTGVSDSISAPAGTADALSTSDSTGIVVWRTRKYNYAGSSYPVVDTTEQGTKVGFQLLAREDYGFGDYRRFEIRIWDGVAWRIGLPGGQNGGHWIPLKWHVITWRLSGTKLDLRIDGRYVDVFPEDVSVTFPGGTSGKLTIGGGPSDYQAVELYRSWLSDAAVESKERQLAARFGVDLMVRIAGDLRMPAGAESYVGFPGLTKIGSTLLCTYFVGATESTNGNHIDSCTSTDGGKTWSSATRIATSNAGNCLANINVTVLSNGDWVGTSYEIASASIQHLMFYRSTNQGASWSVTNVTLGGAVWEGCSAPCVEDPAVPGKLYWPVYTNEGGTYNHVWVYVSTDYGATWPTRRRIANGDTDTKYWAEPAALFRGTEMVALIRDAEPPNFSNPPNEMFESHSTDSGVTWAALVSTTIQADSAGQSYMRLASLREVWLGRPGGRRMAAMFYRTASALWNAAWNNVPPPPQALWIDHVYGGFGGMSYGGIAETSNGVACPLWGATTDANHDDVVCRPNFYEWYLTFAMPGNVSPTTKTLARNTTQQLTVNGAGDYVYAITSDTGGGCSVSASGLFTAGPAAGTCIFTVKDLNGQLLATCTYTVT